MNSKSNIAAFISSFLQQDKHENKQQIIYIFLLHTCSNTNDVKLSELLASELANDFLYLSLDEKDEQTN